MRAFCGRAKIAQGLTSRTARVYSGTRLSTNNYLQSNYLDDSLLFTDLLLCAQPVLLRRTTVAAPLQIQLIGAGADALLQFRRYMNIGRRRCRLLRMDSVPIFRIGLAGAFLRRRAFLARVAFGILL